MYNLDEAVTSAVEVMGHVPREILFQFSIIVLLAFEKLYDACLYSLYTYTIYSSLMDMYRSQYGSAVFFNTTQTAFWVKALFVSYVTKHYVLETFVSLVFAWSNVYIAIQFLMTALVYICAIQSTFH